MADERRFSENSWTSVSPSFERRRTPPGAGDVWFDSGAPPGRSRPRLTRRLGGARHRRVQSPERPPAARSTSALTSSRWARSCTSWQSRARRFRRETPAQTIRCDSSRTRRNRSRPLNPALPPPVLWIIERCLAKDPAERYAHTLGSRAGGVRNVPSPFRPVPPRRPLAARERGRPSAWRRPARLAATALGHPRSRLGRYPIRKKPPRHTEPAPVVAAVMRVMNLTRAAEYDATAVGIAEVVVSRARGHRQDPGAVAPRHPQCLPRPRRNADSAGRSARQRGTRVRWSTASCQRSGSRDDLRVSFTLMPSSRRTSSAGAGRSTERSPSCSSWQSRWADGVAGALRPLADPAGAGADRSPSHGEPRGWARSTPPGLAPLRTGGIVPGTWPPRSAGSQAALRADARFARAHAGLARACAARYAETGEAILGRSCPRPRRRRPCRPPARRRGRAPGARADSLRSPRPADGGRSRSMKTRALGGSSLSTTTRRRGFPRRCGRAGTDGRRPSWQARRAVALRPGFGQNQ
jgi:hypothetical protein